MPTCSICLSFSKQHAAFAHAILLQAMDQRLHDTDSLRECQKLELETKLLVADGALVKLKLEQDKQTSLHAEEVQRLQASLDTASAEQREVQQQLDTASERVQTLETELQVALRSKQPAQLLPVSYLLCRLT